MEDELSTLSAVKPSNSVKFRKPHSAVHAIVVGNDTSDDGSITDDDARAAVQDYKYKEAPENQIPLLDAPCIPGHIISPNAQTLAILGVSKFRYLEEVCAAEIAVAGIRVSPTTSSRSRATTFNSLSLISLAGQTRLPAVQRHVNLPRDSQIMDPVFSFDSRYLAFLLYSTICSDAATESVTHPILLYVIDCEDPELQLIRISNHPVSHIFNDSFSWTKGHELLFRTPLPGRGPAPSRPTCPPGPIVLETGFGHDVKRRAGGERTYQDLLKDSFDCALFEYYCTVQLLSCSLTGANVFLPLSGVIRSCTPSPDDRFLLVKVIHRPFSYFVQYGRFPTTISVYKFDDDALPLVREIVDLDLADSIPVSFDSCRVGPRNVTWRKDTGATLMWVEAQDEGDPKCIPSDDVRDVVWMLPEPFTKPPAVVHSLSFRFNKIYFASGYSLISERWVKTRQRNIWMVKYSDDEYVSNVHRIWTGSYEDRYNDPGEPQLRNRLLYSIVDPDSNHVKLLFAGDGATPTGDEPFVREMDLETLQYKTIWSSAPDLFESALSVLPDNRILIRRESLKQPPELFIIDPSSSSPDEVQITTVPHPCPSMLNVHSELVHYKRADGVQLSGYLYLPPGYSKENGRPLPTVLWAYPREFKSMETASQTIGSPHTFPLDGRPSMFFLLEGYAVLDRMTMPIVGEDNREPNDTYIEQLVANAAAAIDHLVSIGVTDRDRVGVGGHSYGAFMTANLLAHSDLFAAGVARSGAYNRTLTPNGFQREERTLWQAPDVYARMSPYMAADRIRTPLLLIHGQSDNNTGTYPMQSERMFAALKGHGKAPARFVCLPGESHHYKSRESCAHVLWETTRWFSKYVKHKNDSKHTRSKSEFIYMY
uniref:Peptidase S9 prolyl oligopeptidase catalytic domain-containing protein n=1 Tax=Spongospora subterranea TaxID=70186 RepID=A0A0H5R694_9EUKA|eukprot:CRZ09356.1 hypothetical protein [Spongospora subterranea]